MIPKHLHIIWVGDESGAPTRNIESWRRHHQDWQFTVWGNDALASTDWINRAHIEEMMGRELSGVADLMRWEILHRHGGVCVDADSFCVGTIPDWMLLSQHFAAYESEACTPGLIAAGAVGAEPGTPFMAGLIESIRAGCLNTPANVCVGSIRLTTYCREMKSDAITFWPSHFFYPEHYSGRTYTGTGLVLAHQQWGSTLKGRGG